MNKNNLDKLNLEYKPHREDLAEMIIAKSARIQQVKQEGFIDIFRSILADLLNPKLAFTIASLCVAVFVAGLNWSSGYKVNKVTSGSNQLIEEIYNSNSGLL